MFKQGLSVLGALVAAGAFLVLTPGTAPAAYWGRFGWHGGWGRYYGWGGYRPYWGGWRGYGWYRPYGGWGGYWGLYGLNLALSRPWYYANYPAYYSATYPVYSYPGYSAYSYGSYPPYYNGGYPGDYSSSGSYPSDSYAPDYGEAAAPSSVPAPNPSDRGSAPPDYAPAPSSDYGQPPPAAAAANNQGARIRVIVPAAARVWFNGQETSQRGRVRTFEPSGLAPERDYTYEVRAAWREGGRDVSRTRRVDVYAGDSVTVDFTRLAPDQSEGTIPAGTSR